MLILILRTVFSGHGPEARAGTTGNDYRLDHDKHLKNKKGLSTEAENP